MSISKVFYSSQFFHILVEQVNWLRAKARYDRWHEEHITVLQHMGNTIRYFEKMKAEWLERAEKPEQQSEGHRCYSYEQADIWNSLASRARQTFGRNVL
jgi:hypothetical protein